eukprot:GILK01006223.1.p1 GENE.GILK01006223.1~~GILK01006223.1.p1  ORF type:complete len:450 (-),score=46.15 GILK01006223.1:90-1439(-)
MKHGISIVLALGSNQGDRVRNIQNALQAINKFATVKSTSNLYQTKPAFFTEQNMFLNAACMAETNLSVTDLLKAVKNAEQTLGRTVTFRNGPRVIDIDILFHGPTVHESADLSVPHIGIKDRDFVLRPLMDLCPDFVHPKLNVTIEKLYAGLLETSPLESVTPIGSTLFAWGRKTHIMGIANVTPDSFSDGGRYQGHSAAVAHILKMARYGADIIDVGGESTRPGAVSVADEMQMERVVPVIQAVKAEVPSIVISIDTRSAAVAREAVKAGADLVNDVSGGRHDPAMLETTSALQVPIVLQHMRGDPQTMQQHTQYEDLMKDVLTSLRDRVAAAQAAGIPRWNIIIDPGIGFAKTPEQDLTILRHGSMLKQVGLPVLMGVSRKKFLGKVLAEDDPLKRQWGTAAAVASCVAGKADIVRVHDVAEMSQVVRVADAIFRHPPYTSPSSART